MFLLGSTDLEYRELLRVNNKEKNPIEKNEKGYEEIFHKRNSQHKKMLNLINNLN